MPGRGFATSRAPISPPSVIHSAQDGLVASASLHSPGEAIRFNFGATDFVFDADAMREEYNQDRLAAIDAQPIDSSPLLLFVFVCVCALWQRVCLAKP